MNVGRILTLNSRSPDDTTVLTLGDVEVLLRLRWMERPAAWFVDLSLSDGTPLLTCRRLSPGSDLLGGRAIPQLRGRKLLVLGADPYPREALATGALQIRDLGPADIKPGPVDPATATTVELE